MMPGTQRSGVDAAIDLIIALTRRGGSARNVELAGELGIPRASFHRIVGMLADQGVLTRMRGRIAIGPVAAGLASALAKAGDEQDRRRERVLGEAVRPIVNPYTVGRARAPELTSPFIKPPRRRFRIAVSNGAMDNPWQVAMLHSIEFAASRLQGELESVTVVHAHGDARKQVDDIEDLAASGVDGLLISAVSPRALVGVSNRMDAAGLPVVFVERGGNADLACASFVTSDNTAIGQITAQWLADTIGRKGTVLMLYGHADAEMTQSRQATAMDIFARFPGIKVVNTDATRFNRELAYATAADAIARHGEAISGVWCDSGLNSAGSIQAFLGAGFEPGHIPPHTGGDLNLSYKLAVRQKILMASIDYPPAMGIRAFEVLLAAINGAWVPKQISMASRFVASRTSANNPLRAQLWAEDHVRWDMPDDLVFGAGLGPAYDPRAFRVSYPGNSYNRSAASLGTAT
ncbi:substrate-binding domain-containing protein [Devosia sp.]|uniref:substrate-binding domain-containing protein n=1 Tax=Devosia sp. TaxID=1871048 RepID=UPI00261E6CF1|nr:substrate-binding domain-containing protein [Devosia sp.]